MPFSITDLENSDVTHGLSRYASDRYWLNDEAPKPYRPVVLSVSGSHAYGWAGSHSDLDLRGIYLSNPLVHYALSDPPATHVNDTGNWHDDVEVDLELRELVTAMRLLVRGNGNTLEAILTPYTVGSDSIKLYDLRNVARSLISGRTRRHYRGLARNEFRAFDRPGKIKAGLYALRSLLVWVHLVETEGQELEPDILKLAYAHLDTPGIYVIEALVGLRRDGDIPNGTLFASAGKLWGSLDQRVDAMPHPFGDEPAQERLQDAEDWLFDVYLHKTGYVV